MTLTNIDKSYFDKGVFVFENGNYIFIEEIQYSYDLKYWEDTFYPNAHVDPRDASATIQGHKYRRVRHAGDDSFQLPEYIVAEDGKTPVFKIENDGLYMKYMNESDSAYTLLTDIDTITGPTGATGATGDCWHIDAVGYWMTKPDCTSSLIASSSCVSCSGGASTSSGSVPYLFLSMGDGLYTMVSGDVSSAYYRSNDGVTWIAIVSSDIGNTTRWMAIDAIGTGAVDYRTQDTLGTKGKVYYCDGDSWELLFNVSVPRHQVSPTAAYYIASQDGFFMEDYVSTPLNANYIANTIALTADYKLIVKKNTLEPAHFKDGSFGDGFNEGTTDVVEGIKLGTILAAPDDFAGFGLRTYTSTADAYLDMQFYAPDLVDDGLASYDDSLNAADGETRYKLQVRPADLVDATLSGLTTFTNADTYDDFMILIKAGLEITATGIQPLVDDLSLELDAVSGEVQIKESSLTTEGVLPKHLSTTIGNAAKATKVDQSTGLEVLVSATQQALDFDGTNGLYVKNEGIVGYHLAASIADTTKGIKMDTTADKLEILVTSGGGIKFNAGTGALEIDTASLSWLTSVVVNSIEVDAVDYKGDLVLVGAALGTDTYTDIIVSASGSTITVTPATNLANLTSFVDGRIASGGTVPHTHVLSDITDEADKMDIDTPYTNVQITSAGIFLKTATSNKWARLICVDDIGNLGTETPITLP